MANRVTCVFALASVLLACPAMAQIAVPEATPEAKARSAQFRTNLEEATRVLDKDPRLKDLNPQQRKDLIDFVTGNILFATLHELGHAHIQEMGLYVLGREEDAADSHAITALIRMATDTSHDVLVEATKGWFLDDARNQKEGIGLAFYDEHGLDKQRAYEIICLMVGSDPDKFSDLADKVKMPEDRQGTCQGDYSNASWSWETAFKPHLRAPDQPKQKIQVTYGPPGEYAAIAQALKTIGMMEMLADQAANRFVWRRPITFDVQACGEPDLHWDLSTQKIVVCYEIAQDFANLYRGYGLTYALAPQPAKGGKANKK
jgi:hypothetical protein